MSRSYSQRAIKEILGRSFNECNHPDCNKLIVEVDPNTNRTTMCGEIAHIHGLTDTSQRWDPDYPTEKLNEEENLILLCKNHHTPVIDEKDAEEFYTVEILKQWKLNHYLAKESVRDREWVYGGNSLVFFMGGQEFQVRYWLDKTGKLRIYTEEQLAQAQSAKDLSILFSQFLSMISRVDNIDGKPAVPHQVSMNDAVIQKLKEESDGLKSSWSTSNSNFESAAHRLYTNLRMCPDITLQELSLIGTTEKPTSTSILTGEATPERVIEALNKGD